jgi:hypothetical protein
MEAADGGQKELSGLGTHLVRGGEVWISAVTGTRLPNGRATLFLFARDTEALETRTFLMKDIIRPKEPRYTTKLLHNQTL